MKGLAMDHQFLRKLMIPLGGGFVLFLVSVFLLVPLVKKVRKQFRQNSKLITEKVDFTAKAQLIASLDEESLAAKAQLSTLAIPKEKEISLILYALSDPVRNNGFYTDHLEFNLGEVTLSGVEEGEEEKKIKVKKQPIDQVPVSMRVLGPGKNLSALLAEMEMVLPLIDIGTVNVIYSLNGRATVSFDFHLSVSSRLPSYDPEKLTLKDLTLSEQEESLLTDLTTFKKAGFSTIMDALPAAGGSVGRENPFSLID